MTSTTNPPTQDAGQTSPVLSLQIDQHRNHMAILESYHILTDLLCSPTSLSPETLTALRRCLLRIQFFLMHSHSPILSDSDRLALARVRFHDLGQQLSQAEELRRHLLTLPTRG